MKNNRRKFPFVFNGVLPAASQLIARYDYDTIEVCNDSASDIFFSMDGGNTFVKVRPAEVRVWDRCTYSTSLHAYATTASSAARFALWLQDSEKD